MSQFSYCVSFRTKCLYLGENSIATVEEFLWNGVTQIYDYHCDYVVWFLCLIVRKPTHFSRLMLSAFSTAVSTKDTHEVKSVCISHRYFWLSACMRHHTRKSADTSQVYFWQCNVCLYVVLLNLLSYIMVTRTYTVGVKIRRWGRGLAKRCRGSDIPRLKMYVANTSSWLAQCTTWTR